MAQQKGVKRAAKVLKRKQKARKAGQVNAHQAHEHAHEHAHDHEHEHKQGKKH